MAKFLNKKEQAIDFQLTPYGKYKLSIGGLEPAYYSFFDNGVIYDSQYAGFTEKQNEIHTRIKQETSYLEGITFFYEIENSSPPSDLNNSYAGYEYRWYSWYGHDPSDSSFYGFTEGTKDSILEFAKGGLSYSKASDVDWVWMRDWTDRFATKSFAEMIAGSDVLAAEAAVSAGEGSGSHEDDYFTLVYKMRFTSMFDFDINPTLNVPDPDVFSFDSCIGDAYFEGETTQAAPAWKAVTCQGEITHISSRDTRQYYIGSDTTFTSREYEIPQLDVEMNYKVVATTPESAIFAEEVRTVVESTAQFADGNVLRLEPDDLVLYLSEVNTELLSENFEIEVFEIDAIGPSDPEEMVSPGDICTSACPAGYKCKDSTTPGIKRCVNGPMILTRKYFEKKTPQIIDGIMKYSNPVEDYTTEIDQHAVEYWFEVQTDDSINQKIGCQCANIFNKESYYIDIDFECEDETDPEYFDIYGSVTVPEICAAGDEEIYTEDLCEDLEEIE